MIKLNLSDYNHTLLNNYFLIKQYFYYKFASNYKSSHIFYYIKISLKN
jgi:hypothetical protein